MTGVCGSSRGWRRRCGDAAGRLPVEDVGEDGGGGGDLAVTLAGANVSGASSWLGCVADFERRRRTAPRAGSSQLSLPSAADSHA